jgi:hypothetical protein
MNTFAITIHWARICHLLLVDIVVLLGHKEMADGLVEMSHEHILGFRDVGVNPWTQEMPIVQSGH